MDPTPEPRTRLRTIVVFSMFFAVLGAIVVFAYFSTFSHPLTTVILVRHAEKNIEPNNPDPELSPAGQARAQELVRVLGNAGINAIYSTQYKRTQETAKPLADKLQVSLNVIEAKKTEDLINSIRTTNRGQTILVVGHSNTVPEIVTALGGASVPEIPDSDYDNMFIVSIYKSGSAKVTRIKFGSAIQSGNPTNVPMMR